MSFKRPPVQSIKKDRATSKPVVETPGIVTWKPSLKNCIDWIFRRLDILDFRITRGIAGWINELNLAIALGFHVDNVPGKLLKKKERTHFREIKLMCLLPCFVIRTGA